MKSMIKFSIYFFICIGAHTIITASQQPKFNVLRDCAFETMRVHGYFDAMRANGYMGLEVTAPETYNHIIRLAESNLLKKHNTDVTSLTYTHDGRQLISGDVSGAVHVWQPQTGTHISTFKDNAGFMLNLAISPDGSQLASGSGHPVTGDNTMLRTWNPATGTIVQQIPQGDRVKTTAYSPSGNQLAIGSGNQVRLYNPTTYELIRAFEVNGRIEQIAYNPRDAQLAVGYGNSIQFFNPEAGNSIRTIDILAPVLCLAYNHAGSQLAVGILDSEIVRIYNTQTGTRLQTLSTGEETAPGQHRNVECIAFSPSDDNLLAVASSNGTACLWSSTTGARQRTLDVRNTRRVICAPQTTSITFSPDGTQLACGGGDGHIRLWNLNLELLRRACHLLNLKEILLVEKICRKGSQGIQTHLPAGSDQARLFAVLPKPIRTIIARYVTYDTSKCTIQ